MEIESLAAHKQIFLMGPTETQQPLTANYVPSIFMNDCLWRSVPVLMFRNFKTKPTRFYFTNWLLISYEINSEHSNC